MTLHVLATLAGPPPSAHPTTGPSSAAPAGASPSLHAPLRARTTRTRRAGLPASLAGFAIAASLALSPRLSWADDPTTAPLVDPLAPRLELPRGPGSRLGWGGLEPIGATALPRFVRELRLPPGAGGLEPPLALVFSPGTGQSVFGLDLDLPIPALELDRSDGLPRTGMAQVDQLRLVGLGRGSRWVEVQGDPHASGAKTYREGIEADAPVRIRAEAGELRVAAIDGRTWIFADEPGARVTDAAGVVHFARPTALVDAFGNRVEFVWHTAHAASRPRLAAVRWNEGAAELAVVTTPRPDPVRSFAGGVAVEIDERVAALEIRVDGTRTRTLFIDYATDDVWGGSRVEAIREVASDGTEAPTWRVTWGDPEETMAPRVWSIDDGLVVDGAAVRWLDVDGDALPDLLDGRTPGAWRWRRNAGGEGLAAWQALGASPSFALDAGTFATDVDGDGRAELLRDVASESGEIRVWWGGGAEPWSTSDGVHLGVDVRLDDPELALVDLDDDGRSDVFVTLGEEAVWLRAQARPEQVDVDGGGSTQDVFAAPELVPAPPAELRPGAPGVAFADVDGDGLADLVRVDVTAGRVRHARALGHGRFDAVAVLAEELSLTGLASLRIADANGDGIDDVLRIAGDRVDVELGRGHGLTSANPRDIPALPADASIFTFDADGDGGVDVIVHDADSGTVSVHPLLGGLAALPRHVENGAGLRTSMAFRPAAWAAARAAVAGHPWTRHVPIPLAVLAVLDERDVDATVRTEIEVRDPIRAGEARRFVGFGEITEHVRDEQGDVLQRRWRTHADDTMHEAMAGLVVASKVGDGEAWLEEEQRDYVLLEPGVGITAARLARTDHFALEGESHAQSRRTATIHAWDGWGNPVRVESLGQVDASSGADVPGDERVDVYTHAHPREEWLDHGGAAPRNLTSEHRIEARDGTLHARTQWRYDGEGEPALDGLPLGESTRGARVRTRVWVEGDTWIEARRRRFDARGREIWVQDGAGTTHALQWDALSRHVIEERRWLDGHGNRALVTRASWSPVHGGLESLVDPRGATWRITYDGLGSPTARYEPGDDADAPTVAWETRFDAHGGIWRRERAKLDEGGHAEVVEHLDARGRLRARVIAAGSDAAGRDANEPPIAEIVNVHDGLGRVVLAARGAVTDGEAMRPFTLDPSDVHALAGAAELRTHTRFDALDRELARDDDAGVVHVTSYAPGSSRHRTIRASLRERSTDPGHTPSRVRAWVQSLAQDAEDVDRITTRFHDGLGRVVAVEVDAADEAVATLVWTWTWDAASRLVSIVDPAGSVTLVEHDGAGRRIAIDGQDTGRTQLAYDGAGRWVARADATGARSNRELDALGRPLRAWTVDPVGVIRSDVRWTWDVAREPDVHDAPGLLLGVDDDAGRLDFAYDLRGREIRRTRRGVGCSSIAGAARPDAATRGDAFTVSMGHRYDARGLVVADVFGDATFVTREYDARGLLRAVPGFVDAITWDPAGRWREVQLGNGVAVTRALDHRGHVTSTDVSSDDATIEAIEYTYDDAGRLVRITDGSPASSPLRGPRRDASFQYDGMGRLVRDEGAWGRGVTTFDGLGRVSSRALDDTARSLRWDPARPHVVTDFAAQVLTWDEAGRLSTIGATEGAPAPLGEPLLPPSSWIHDAWGHPVEVRLGDGMRVRWVWDYAGERVGVCHYDPAGRVLHASWTISPEQSLEDGVLVRWVHAMGERWAETRTPWPHERVVVLPVDDTLPSQHLGLAALLWLGCCVRRRRGASSSGDTRSSTRHPCRTRASRAHGPLVTSLLVALVGSGSGCATEAPVELVPLRPDADTRFHVHDRTGSSALVTDARGAVVTRVVFDPRGQVVHGAGALPIHFAGSRHHASVPAYDFGPRVLLAPLGRFTSPDPKLARDELERGLDVPLQLDPHGYAEDDPLNQVDPDGLEAKSVSVGVSITIGVFSFSASVSLVTDDKGGVAVATSTGSGVGLGVSGGATLSTGTIHGTADIHSFAGSSATAGASGGPGIAGVIASADAGVVEGHVAHSVGVGVGVGTPEGHVFSDAPTSMHTLREPDRSPVPAAMQAAVRTAAAAGDTKTVATATTTLARIAVTP